MRIGKRELRVLHAICICLLIFCGFLIWQNFYKPRKLAQPVGAESIDAVDLSLFLLGDAGDLDPLIEKHLQEALNQGPHKRTAIFMGDNIYPAGLPDPDDSSYEDARTKLLKILGLFKDRSTEAVFVPGNHDWGDYHLRGFSRNSHQRILNQERFVNDFFKKQVFFPEKGCPGPVLHQLAPKLYALILDTQYLLYERGSKFNECQISNPEVYEKFDELSAAVPKDASVLFITHHPLKSVGRHGGGKEKSGCNQDLNCPGYKAMTTILHEKIQKFNVLACIAGHDHSLQLLPGDAACKYYIVSGAVSHPTDIVAAGAILASSRPGYIRIDSLKNGAFVFRVFALENGSVNEIGHKDPQ